MNKGCYHRLRRAPDTDALECEHCGIRISGQELLNAATRIRAEYEREGKPVPANHLAALGETEDAVPQL